MMKPNAEPIAAIQAHSPAGLPSQASVGDQQAHIACASLDLPTSSLSSALPSQIPGKTLPTTRLARPRLGPAARRVERGGAARVDERCPYCRATGYALHADRLGNLTRLEGTCRFCGMHAVSLLA